MRLDDKPLDAGKTLQGRGLGTGRRGGETAGGKPVWELVEAWLKSQPGGRVGARRINTPRLVGVKGNPGLA